MLFESDATALLTGVLVLTADPNAVKTLRDGARRMRAIEKVEERIKGQHGPASPQMEELQSIKGTRDQRLHERASRDLQDDCFPDRKSASQGR